MVDADINTDKRCTKCGAVKARTEFNKDKNRVDGLFPQCRECTRVALRQRYATDPERYSKKAKENYQQNKDSYKNRAKQWALNNPERRHQAVKDYLARNPETRRQTNKNHRGKNPGMYAEHYKARQTRKRKAMPTWANRDAIKAIYRQSAFATRMTGVKYHVDHYYPLKSDLVCGLHNEFNLRIIPAFDNLSKSNKLLD